MKYHLTFFQYKSLFQRMLDGSVREKRKAERYPLFLNYPPKFPHKGKLLSHHYLDQGSWNSRLSSTRKPASSFTKYPFIKLQQGARRDTMFLDRRAQRKVIPIKTGIRVCFVCVCVGVVCGRGRGWLLVKVMPSFRE